MQILDAIRSIMFSKGIKPSVLSRSLGISPQLLNSRLNSSKSMSVDVACETARALDYRVALVPCSAKLPAGSVVLESGRDGE